MTDLSTARHCLAPLRHRMHALALAAMVPAIVSCSNDKDALNSISNGAGATLAGNNSSVPVFDTDFTLIEREPTPVSEDVAIVVNPDRMALFGDLHVHTENSFDAFTFGSLATPEDAYRYAQGEAIRHPAGYDIQLDRPLDFYAVTDHAMMLGLARRAADTSSPVSALAPSQPLHDFNKEDNLGVMSLVERGKAFGQFVPQMITMLRDGEADKQMVLDIARSTWEENTDATDAAYAPGRFTTFPAYEYTSSTDTRGNLHRNVIFQSSARLPAIPFSRLNAQNPERLWDWMDTLRGMGVESLAIPHNSNGSDGEMFKQIDWAGDAMDADYSDRRLRNEPLVELTQIKGTSETHPMLSDTDEWAGFELMEYRIGSKLDSRVEGSYVRQALRTGLELDARNAGNPYKYGFIGSTDTHVGGGALQEDKFFSKAGVLDGLPERRGSIPPNWFVGKFAGWLSENMVKEVDGHTYMASNVFEYWGASGLAGVWAESNTREAIYAALRRKETFATSGPRIRVRFFAGFDYPDDLADDPELLRKAYAAGVPMGGELNASGGNASPRFVLWALGDDRSAPLDRIQIIKGWMADGTSHEQVIDVACSDGAAVDPVSMRCPDNGAWVSAEDCSIAPDVGDAEFKVMWQDPQFNPEQDAFYYVRVLENPSCRWSTWDALRAGVEPRSDLPRTIQERAWSSPIWYRANEAPIPAEG